MGTPKALLDWGGEPLVSYIINQLTEAGCDEVVVVLGHSADLIHRQIRRLPCRVMLNPRYHAGRSGSLRIGAKAVSRDADQILISSVDQPRPAEFLRSILDAHQPSSIATRPSCNGKHGHPLVVSGSLREEMMTVPDSLEGLRSILESRSSKIMDVPTDDICLLDLNTPEDYDEAKRRLGVGG